MGLIAWCADNSHLYGRTTLVICLVVDSLVIIKIVPERNFSKLLGSSQYDFRNKIVL